jgi:glycosyltransferase involved in cell wall biosynthesis
VRILMISKACISGAYQTKLEALARFPDLDLHVIVPPYWKGPEGATRLERRHLDGYRLIVSPMRFNGQFHIHYYPEFRRWLRQIAPDIVHFDEEPYNLATYLGLRASKASGAWALFFTWQNLHRSYPWPFRAMEQACFRLADYALAGNQDAGQVLRRKGYTGPLAVVPQFGVDANHFAPAPRPGERGDDRPLRIGYAGRLVSEKGVHILLDALANFTPAWEAILVGGGPAKAALHAQAQALGIADRVEFRDPLPSGEMPAFFREIDVLVLPSISRPNWTEQFGRVLIEAMASEVVVVGSDSGEIPHVIGEAGLIFPEGDASALRARLEKLAGDGEQRRRLAQAGRARVLSQFTQEHIAEQTYRVYQAILEVPDSSR